MNDILPTTYPTCQTCKHWTRINQVYDGKCSRIGVTFDTYKQEGYVLMTFAPGVQHGWPGALTRKDYGCLLHSDLAEAGG